MVNPYPIIGHFTPRVLGDFFNELRDVDNIRQGGTKDFLISSPGGDIGVMLAMFDQIRRSKSTTAATGLVQSAAAVLLQAGIVRRMTRNALLMFHEPEKINGEFTDESWSLHSILMGLVEDRTGLHTMEVADIFDGKFITAPRALTLNLIDEVIDLPVIPVYQGSNYDSTNN